MSQSAAPASDAARRGLSNQRRGREAEWKIRDALRAAGWTVVRAAGSLGKADLVALRGWSNGRNPQVVFVQVKTRAVSVDEWNDLLREAGRVGASAVLATVRPRKPIQWEYFMGLRQAHSQNRPAVEWAP